MPSKQFVLHVNDVDVNVVDIGAGTPTLVFPVTRVSWLSEDSLARATA